MPLVKQGRLAALMAIHDKEPRVWSERELALLTEVTERSWAHIERVRSEEAARTSEERLRLATDAAAIGIWDYDPATDTLVGTTDARRFSGCRRRQVFLTSTPSCQACIPTTARALTTPCGRRSSQEARPVMISNIAPSDFKTERSDGLLRTEMRSLKMDAPFALSAR